jgi:filamentous hemagglutinin family protein
MKSTRIHPANLVLVLLPLFLTFGTKGAIAQITPAKDGTGTVIQTQNNQLNISGGTQAGQNQFHSFQQFGVNAGQTANFMSNPNIANILGRVTGGDASLINGILKVTGSNANLFLINPSGIVFGKDASLNLPAAFTATTANGIGFGNGNWFNAVGSNNYATLTSNPTSFGFIGTSGSLVNAGNLSVNPGQSIALVGGTIVNTGTIAALGGNITIAAIPGEKMVRIGQAGTVLSLDLPTSDRALINAPTTTPLSLPALLTGGSIPSAMGVVVEDGVIKLTGGSASVNGTLNADGTGSQSGGNVIVYADNHLSFGGTISAKGGELGGNGGFVDTSGKGTIAISPNAKVVTTAVKGLTGTWLIDPADLEVVAGAGGTIGGAGSSIGAGTIVTALNGTNVNLQADNSITVNAAINSSTNASAGNLTLTAPTANLNQAIVLKTGSTLSGTATTVNVGANGTVQNGIDASAIGGTVNLAAATYTLGQTIFIRKNVTVQGAVSGSTKVSGGNAVTVFQVLPGRSATLDRLSVINGNSSGNGGGIINDKGTLIISNSAISNNSAPQQFGGGIYNDGTLTIKNSSVSGNNAVNGAGITSRGKLSIENSTIENNVAQISSGGITVSGDFSLQNSKVLNNISGDDYGGISINSFTRSTISDSVISGNRAKLHGALYQGGMSQATITNTVISNNWAENSAGLFNGGDMTFESSTVSGNIGQNGHAGVINFSGGKLLINNSTVSNNSSLNYGVGGILNSGQLTISSSTISQNSAKISGGGIANANNGMLTIRNSIIAGNVAPDAPEIDNYYSVNQITSQGYNIIGHSGSSGTRGTINTLTTDKTPTETIGNIIRPLGNYGGSTQTHALVANSPAIDAGDPTSTLTTDQRGGQRGNAGLNSGSRIDIGSYEATNSALVTNTLDDNSIGSLRSAINFANTNINSLNIISPTDIRFNIGTVGSAQTIALTSALPVIAKSATIDGWTQGIAGYNGVPLITVSGSNLFRVFEVGSGATVGMNGLAIVNGATTTSGAGILNNGNTTIRNSIIQNNTASGITSDGGGIYNRNQLTIDTTTLRNNTSGDDGGAIRNDGTLTIANSTLSGNTAQSSGSSFSGGGAILNTATATIRNSTLSGNRAKVGGGIRNDRTLTLTNSTVTANTATEVGGGVVNTVNPLNPAQFGRTTLQNTIIAGNTDTSNNAPDARAFVANSFMDNGNNLIGVGDTFNSSFNVTTFKGSAATPLNPLLAALGNYGGATQTHALLPGSAAINAGNSTTFDQRGKARVGIADIGAFESQGFTIAATGIATQSNTVNSIFATPITATVTANNVIEPVAGGTVTYIAPSSGATITAGIRTATIDALGNANLTPTATTTAGTYTALAETLGATGTAIFNLTNTPDVPFSIAATGGTSQNTVVNTPYAQRLQVRVLDQFNNVIPGATVSFSVPGSGASGVFVTNTANTDANGVATIAIKANTKAGLFTAKGSTANVTGTADFALTNLADVAKNIATTSGSNQTTVVDTNFANNLVATVTDQFGNPIANTTVTFTVPGTNASGTFTPDTNIATTDATGKATIALKANTKAGLFTAQGSTANVTGTADFALTNLADVANNIATTSGSNQQTTVDTNFANKLVATVTDKFGNPVANSTVTFSVPGTNASGVFVINTANTDVNGVATIALKANTKAGTFTTSGSVNGVTPTADFNLTNLADVASQVTATAGSGQSTIVNTNFADNLIATVTDKFHCPWKRRKRKLH